MLNFSFLRQHAPDLLPIAVPVGLAADPGVTDDNTA